MSEDNTHTPEGLEEAVATCICAAHPVDPHYADMLARALLATDGPIGILLAAKDAEIAEKEGAYWKAEAECQEQKAQTARYRAALEPFRAVAETEPVRKGGPDACWCGQDGAVIRYRDFAAVLTALSDNGGGA
jgi:hypothetical protein